MKSINFTIDSALLEQAGKLEGNSIAVGQAIYNPDDRCIDFCNSVMEVHSFNEALTGFILAVFSLFVMGLYLTLSKDQLFKEMQEENPAAYLRMKSTLYNFAQILKWIFFGWIIYQRFFGILK